MLSKNWKLVLIATLSATFVACGSQKQESTSSSSAFSGVWIRKIAYDNFVRNERSTRAFCAKAKANRAAHGLSSGNGLPFFVPAVSIENNGDVRRFEQIPNSATPAQGNVGYNGIYNGEASLNQLLSTNSLFQVSGANMTVSQVTAYGTGQSKVMVSVDRAKVSAYIEKMKVCIWGRNSEQVDEDWVNGRGYNKSIPVVTDDELEDFDDSATDWDSEFGPK